MEHNNYILGIHCRKLFSLMPLEIYSFLTLPPHKNRVPIGKRDNILCSTGVKSILISKENNVKVFLNFNFHL